MLRVHFTAEDLARVRVAAAPDPLWELTGSVQVLATDACAPRTPSGDGSSGRGGARSTCCSPG
ncbi:hypothetical protein ACW4TU_43690 [Streptomyces sp. QTS52]